MAGEALYAVILAGGASSRFWPFDGDANPKFLLSADGKQSLLAEAWVRSLDLTDASRVLVVTGANQAEIIRRELPALPTNNLLVEPARRDTMAAAGWAMAEVFKRDPEAYALLTPADSHYEPQDAFPVRVKEALESGSLEEGRLYALGVTPTRPETGFGYIEARVEAGAKASSAKRFVEKPDRETAEGYVQSGEFFWNVGSFLWRAKDFLAEVERQHPKARAAIQSFAEMNAEDSGFKAGFEAIHKTSIDYGVMEGAEKIGLLPLSVNFDDIGTWDALAERDALKAAWRHDVDSENCVAQSKGSVAFVGVRDLLVVVEGNQVLVTRHGQGQDVKKVAQAFAEQQKSNG